MPSLRSSIANIHQLNDLHAMISYPPQPNRTMSSQSSKFDGRVTSSDWREEYKDVEMLNPEDFDNAFFDVTSAAAASLYGGPVMSRQSSVSRPVAARGASTDSLKYPPMPPLGSAAGKYGPYGSNITRGLSTESWFDPASLPAIEKDAQRISSSDFINAHILKEEVDAPAPSRSSKRKRSQPASAPAKKNSKRSRTAAASKRRRPRSDSVPDTMEDAVESLGPNDVAMGRGGMANNHAGNHQFRAFAASLKPRYEKLSKEEKTGVSRELVQMVHDAGGRFLAKEPSTDLWYEVDFKQARKKASQALREESRPQRAARKARET